MNNVSYCPQLSRRSCAGVDYALQEPGLSTECRYNLSLVRPVQFSPASQRFGSGPSFIVTVADFFLVSAFICEGGGGAAGSVSKSYHSMSRISGFFSVWRPVDSD